MSNEQDLVKSPGSVGEPIRKAFSGPISRNRFLKILSRKPVEYHPIFGAYDRAPEMPIDQIATAAVSLGDTVLVLEGDAAIKEGWDQSGKTLRQRGAGLVLVRRPAERFIEGIGVYPLPDNETDPHIGNGNTVPQHDADLENNLYLKKAA